MLSDVLDQIEERGIRKGEQRGVKKGEISGIKKIKKAIEINMLKNNYSDKEIEEISKIIDRELNDIKNS